MINIPIYNAKDMLQIRTFQAISFQLDMVRHYLELFDFRKDDSHTPINL